MDAHLVLRQGARLVGTDDGRGAHRLAGVHLPHQVVRAQHAAHAQGEGERDAHRQSLGHGYDDQSDGHHDALQQCGREVEQVEVAALAQVDKEAARHDEQCQHVADARYDGAQAVQLVIEGRLDAVVNLCSGEYFSVFGSIAHRRYLQNAVAVDYGGAT